MKSIAELSDQCCEACRDPLAKIEAQRLDRGVRLLSSSTWSGKRSPAVAGAVVGNANTFSANLGQSMRRFDCRSKPTLSEMMRQ